MCGIVGYVGDRRAQDVVVEGLRRLEYRGYDSAGIALVDGASIAWRKRAGKLANLEKAMDAVAVGIFLYAGQSCTAGSRLLLEKIPAFDPPDGRG